ncbi:MAG: DNA cytosine methyltransferase [Candidatus Nitrohelix vancouverensis]|uniref:Cytosine-specific methyltransferase n=1 Tax=Candidatus Nitrohelix vancouverensis TaxID=2705534 RepID=A0A7T0C0D2_9BACT|nr:MAG: DNA cytosine methyltransferase [Candidatus Nitrohelix vancouverensis]
MNWNKFKFIDLFAGIGGIRIPFDRLGGTCVFTSEWDKYAQQMYFENFGDKPNGDITQIYEDNIPEHDVLLAGFPCQPFSIMGEGQGFADTRGTLFFDIERIIKAKKPKAFLLENVKQLVGHDGGRTFKVIMERLRAQGYTVYSKVLNALNFGVPQKRERIIIVGFREKIDFTWPKGTHNYPPLANILEEDSMVDPSLFASKKIQQSRIDLCKNIPDYPSIWHQNKSGNISALPYSCALRAGASYSYLLVNGRRRLSAREMLRLQGFPDSFKIVVSYTQLRKQAGNSVTVPLIQAVAENMIEALRTRAPKRHNQEQMILIWEEGRISA